MEAEDFIRHLKLKIFRAVEDAESIVVGDEVLTDGSDGIFEGRYELGNHLLAEFDKWGF